MVATMVRVILAAAGLLVLAACAGPEPAPTADPSPPPSAATAAPEPSAPTATPSATSESTAVLTATRAATSSRTGSSKTATLKATTDGPATITYLEDGAEVREDISGPWEKTVELTDSSNRLTLTVESSGGGSVGCEITTDGVHIKNSNTSSGGSATTRCNATISS
jgi:hypothetical protein